MSFETKVLSLITSVKTELNQLKASVSALQGSSGTASPASETVAGVLEIATQTETNTGTDDSRAVSPLKFQTRLVAFAQPLSANLTTLAAVVSGAMGRTLLTSVDDAAAKTSLNLAKADVGLGNTDNTSDANKPVSTAQQTALNLKADLASPALTGSPSAPTAAPGTNTTQIATTAFTSAAITAAAPPASPAASETVSGIAELATQAETNTGTDDLRIVTPLKFQTRLAAFAQPLAANLTTLAGVVSGAMGRTLLGSADAAAAKASLALVKADVGLGNVDNTSDVNKPVSTAQQTALDLKANLASPVLSGVPTAPTASAGTNTTQLATTAFVSSSVAAGLPAVIDAGAP